MNEQAILQELVALLEIRARQMEMV